MEDQIMKTTKRSSSKTLPSPIKVSIYLLVVAVCCFINWTVLRAGDPVNSVSNSLEERLAAALVPETDPEPALEDWMLTFAHDYVADNAESEIALENWMVDRLEFQCRGAGQIHGPQPDAIISEAQIAYRPVPQRIHPDHPPETCSPADQEKIRQRCGNNLRGRFQ
jgi:hypothetical protein